MKTKSYDVIVVPLSAGGTVTVPCPVGKRVKILSVWVAGSGAEGPQVFLTISRGTNLLWEGASQPMTASITHVTWGIGNTDVCPRQENVDPATGAVTYNQQVTGMSAGLIDAWWPFEVQLASSFLPGTNLSLVTYAIADLD